MQVCAAAQIKCKTVTGKTICKASKDGIIKLFTVAGVSKFMWTGFGPAL